MEGFGTTSRSEGAVVNEHYPPPRFRNPAGVLPQRPPRPPCEDAAARSLRGILSSRMAR